MSTHFEPSDMFYDVVVAVCLVFFPGAGVTTFTGKTMFSAVASKIR